MNIGFEANREPVVLLVEVKTARPEKICIRVNDRNKPYTCYTDRHKTVNGYGKFFVRMPQSPEVAIIEVFNGKNGNIENDNSFKCRIKDEPLRAKVDLSKCRRPGLVSFIRFAQEFSERCGTISAGGSVYQSNDGKFRIDYVDKIRDLNINIPDGRGGWRKNPNYGKVMTTPSRISEDGSVIEVSAYDFKRYTVPMRFAILCHEYSHVYMNDTPADEIEADINGLLIYLSLGYPKIEAYKAFTEVFKYSDTRQNRERDVILLDFIENFDKHDYRLC